MLTSGALMAITILMVSSVSVALSYSLNDEYEKRNMEFMLHYGNVKGIVGDVLSQKYYEYKSTGKDTRTSLSYAVDNINSQIGSIEASNGYLFTCTWDGNFTLSSLIIIYVDIYLSDGKESFDSTIKVIV